MLIQLDPLDDSLPVGLSVRADIIAGEAANVLLLPREAIEWRGASAFVRRVRPTGGSDEVAVEIGLADATRIQIMSGLAEGDSVLLP